MLSTAEIESLRHHLGYGNVGIHAYPYTPDGFYEVFTQIVAPNLSKSTETTATTNVTAAGVASITLADATDILPYTALVIDAGEDTELVTVRNVSGLVVSARFALAHVAQPYPVAVLSGTMRCRLLLKAADVAWAKEQSGAVTGTAGIKQLGRGEIEYFPGGSVLADISGHYATIRHRLSSLTRVPIADDGGRRAHATIEPY